MGQKRREQLVKGLTDSLNRDGGFWGGQQPNQDVVEDAMDALASCLVQVIRCSDEPDEELLKKLYIHMTPNLSNPPPNHNDN